MTEKFICYARVSTKNQDLENQVHKLKKFCEAHGYEYNLRSEIASSVSERPELNKIFQNLDEYDGFIVTKLDRFARSMKDLILRIEKLDNKDVNFICVDQPINTTSKYGKLMFNVLGAIAEFERGMIRERMSEGFEKAKDEGRVGRPRKISGELEDKFRKWWDKYGGSPSILQAFFESQYDVSVSYDTIYRTADRLGLREGDSDE